MLHHEAQIQDAIIHIATVNRERFLHEKGLVEDMSQSSVDRFMAAMGELRSKLSALEAELEANHSELGFWARLSAWLAAVCGVILGLSAFVVTQMVTKEYFEPILEICGRGAAAVSESRLHAYEPLLGGPFVCMITQFLLALAQRPAGLLAWGVIAGIALPASTLMHTEAGRGGSRGLLKYPTPLTVLSQVLGISVIFPAAWVPAYAYGRGSVSAAVAPARAYASAALSLPFAALTVALFSLDPESRAWTLVAGALGGPLVALGPLCLWKLEAPPHPTAEAVAAGAHALKRVYALLGAVSFVGWLVNVRLAAHAFGRLEDGGLAKTWQALWAEAHPAVAFMTIDAAVLYIGLVLAILVGMSVDYVVHVGVAYIRAPLGLTRPHSIA